MITTFGHSTLEAAAAIRALDSGGVDVLIDVRSHPTSRFAQWQLANVRDWVWEQTDGAVRYEWRSELGGWDARHFQNRALRDTMEGVGVDLAAYAGGAFPKQRIGRNRKPISEDSPEWTNQGLYDYAWYTAIPEFQDGIDKLINDYGALEMPTAAIMCAEAVWWRCHRSMIADVLVYRGVPVHHIQPRWTDHVAALGNRLDRYPDEVKICWGERGQLDVAAR